MITPFKIDEIKEVIRKLVFFVIGGSYKSVDFLD